MPQIVLHVGAYKTGTSFIQHTLASNRDALASDGILYPGRGRRSHFSAVREFRGTSLPRRMRGPTLRQLVESCLAWEGPLAILSAENLSLLREDGASRLLEAFNGNDVHVVYGARDIARAVPSQWQSVIRNVTGMAPTFPAYVQAVKEGGTGEVARSFWQTNDWTAVLQTWAPRVGRSGLTLLTVPPRGADIHTLWTRFGDAVGIDASRYPPATMLNTSLGAESAELVRLISRAAAVRSDLAAERVALNSALRGFARKVLAPRRPEETTVVMPPDAADWVAAKTDALRSGVEAVGPAVAGSLDDLSPHVPSDVPTGATTRPETLPVRAVLEAAIDGLSRWGSPPQIEAIRRSDQGEEARLSVAVSQLVDVLDRRAVRRS